MNLKLIVRADFENLDTNFDVLVCAVQNLLKHIVRSVVELGKKPTAVGYCVNQWIILELCITIRLSHADYVGY